MRSVWCEARKFRQSATLLIVVRIRLNNGFGQGKHLHFDLLKHLMLQVITKLLHLQVLEHPGVSVGERGLREEPQAEAAVTQQRSAANRRARIGHEDHRHGILQ